MPDIGEILFRDILQMSAYPGSPFTGNIFQDLVMYFLVPSVFIILIVYMTVARIIPSGMRKMRLLLGITVYLFIIAGGYYQAFALLAGPYFIFLIFFLGLIYFVIEHFRGAGGHAAAGGGAAGPYPHGGSEHEGKGGGAFKTFMGMGEINPAERRRMENREHQLQEQIKHLDKQIERAHSHASQDPRVFEAIAQLEAQRMPLVSEWQQLYLKMHGSYPKTKES